MSGYERVIEALRQRDLLVPSWGAGARSLCPSHDDKSPSLSVGEGDDGRALVYCHAGCSVADVVGALGLGLGDLFAGERKPPTVQLYVYTDEGGEPLYRIHRTDPKGFWQERWEDGEWKNGLRDTRRVLFRLPKVREAAERSLPIYLVEGEKDVLRIEEAGGVATTCPGGAGKWREEYAGTLAGANVIVVGDRDEDDKNGRNAGRLHVSRVRLGLQGVAASVRVVWPRDGCADSTEHLNAGWGLDEFVEETIDLSAFAPVDWREYETPDLVWLFEPYIPARARVLAFGAPGSLKSLWAMWVSTKLSNDGKRVAYFSLEMTPTQTVERLKRLNPDRDNFICFTKNLKFDNAQHVDQIIQGLKGYDLIVIDSWSAAHQFGGKNMSSNDEVAALDNQVFLPIIEQTGASLLILDNVGHDFVSNKGETVKTQHARGASAKGDKMEVTLWFSRPLERNNYRTTITHKKMRIDYPMPDPVTVETPRERIEFYRVDSSGAMTSPMWEEEGATYVGTPPPATVGVRDTAEMDPFERRRLARLKDTFKTTEV